MPSFILSVLLLIIAALARGVEVPPAVTPVPPAERLVGIAYTTWHSSKDWGDGAWGVPELGGYRSDDRAVIRQHAAWLSDAGVDFIFIDWSNDIDHHPPEQIASPSHQLIEEATTVVFDEFAKLTRRPRIVLMLGCPEGPEAATDGRLSRKADQVWRTFAQNPRFQPLLQRYLGKPLLMVYAGTPTVFGSDAPTWNDARFTVRWLTGFITEQGHIRDDQGRSRLGYWSWEDRGTQTYPVVGGRPEAMTVVASWRAQGEPGQPGFIAPGLRDSGKTFRAQWDRACAIGPRFALVVSWNEWSRNEQPSVENSKDIEPSRELGRTYLDLLTSEITRFKTGRRP